jgi:hypothetical protein
VILIYLITYFFHSLYIEIKSATKSDHGEGKRKDGNVLKIDRLIVDYV